MLDIESKLAAAPEHDRILRTLMQVVQDLTGLGPDQIDTGVSFLEAGVDSLMLIQASQRLQDRLGIELSMVQLLEDLPTLDDVARHIAQALPAGRLAQLFPPPTPEAARPPPPAVASAVEPPPPPAALVAIPSLPLVWPIEPMAPTVAGVAAVGGAPAMLERLFGQQMQVMTQQLGVLSRLRGFPDEALPGSLAAPEQAPAAAPAALASQAEEPPAVRPPAPAVPTPARFERFGPYQPIEVGPRGGLTPRQQSSLHDFMARYVARTATSKALAQRYRGKAFGNPDHVRILIRIAPERVHQDGF